MATEGCANGFPVGLTLRQRFAKRLLDIVLSALGLVLTGWLMLLGAAAASLSTRQPGFFRQVRVGRNGRHFKVIKLRTMRRVPGMDSTVTTLDDVRITRVGRILRRTKIDELPQLLNVLCGQMSLVGPRPDVPGFADLLTGREQAILSVRPGITGPATLAFRDEETMLANAPDPKAFNREVLYPKKVELNLAYIAEYSLGKDVRYILQSLLPGSGRFAGPLD